MGCLAGRLVPDTGRSGALVMKDTARLDDDFQGGEIETRDTSHLSLASTGSMVSSGRSNHLVIPSVGPSSEGTILNVTEGEDRITSQVPAGDFVSTMGTPLYGDGYVSEPSSYFSGSGYVNHGASYGSPVNNPCCPENCHSYYVGYEALFIRRRADEAFTLSTRNYMGNYDFEYGHRITLGQMLDCVDGVEFVYTGPFTWDRGWTIISNSSSLRSNFTLADDLAAADIDTFNGAFRHIQIERNKFQSYEANRRWYAWDILSTLIGIRTIQYDEEYLFDTVDNNNRAGFFRSNLRNYLIGLQVGGDVYRPVGQRLSIGTKSRMGIYGNFNKGETILANAGDVKFNNRDRDVDVAGAFQFGANARYRILPRLTASVGYEAWTLYRMATVSDQVYQPITEQTGLTYRTRDTVFMHGATGGVEITW